MTSSSHSTPENQFGGQHTYLLRALRLLQLILKVCLELWYVIAVKHKHVLCLGNWSDGLREILASCYHHHGLDPETYVFKDPEDNLRERSFLPEELRPHPPPPNSPASRLMPYHRGKRLRSEGDELEDDDRENLENQRKRQKGYDPFSDEPTPLAVRRKRRK